MRTLSHFLCLLLFISWVSVVLSLEDSLKVDCIPDINKYGHDVKGTCDYRRCIYEVSKNLSVPWCYFPKDYGYRAEETLKTTKGWFIKLVRNENLGTLFGSDALFLNLIIEFQSNSRLRIKITNDFPRYEIPIPLYALEDKAEDPLYEVDFGNDVNIFSFQIKRKANGQVLLNADLPGLLFSEQYLQIPLKLASSNVYGLGQNEQMSLRHDMNWKVWNGWARDGVPNGHDNIYGVHPVLTVLEETGNAHTLVFMNSNAQEWALMPTPALIYRTTGGILDFYVFLGPSPEESIQQYTELVGRYPLPPYWSLGYHLCRYGYTNTSDISEAYQRTVDNQIPIDAQWTDIDVMHRFLDFSVDEENFKDLPHFVTKLHENDKKFVTIVDPGIDIVNKDKDGNYAIYSTGNTMDVWIKNSDESSAVKGEVWPYGPVYFPDFFKETTKEWWKMCIRDFLQKLPVDGLWIDMNEPSNFLDGSESGCSQNSLNYPPFIPRDLVGYSLFYKTICPDSVQRVNGKSENHYNVHSLYGWSESKATVEAIHAVTGVRSFVLTRSSFIGSGRWAAVWLGDNKSSWKDLKASIIGVLQFNMFGIPHVGADICGFGWNTSSELCIRWHQVGAFYPFSRNHNSIGNDPQDPGVFGSEAASIIRSALLFRYSLLPYLYTLFYEHATKGSTVARSLWNAFPKDNQTWNIDDQFLWGSSLLISPVLEEGIIVKRMYLPGESRWYDVSHLLTSGEVKEMSLERGTWFTANASLEIVPLHFRGGQVFVMQDPGEDTTKSRTNPYHIEVALDDKYQSSGSLYVDDGISLGSLEKKEYFLAEYSMAIGILKGKVVRNNYKISSVLNSIGVNGLDWISISRIEINHENFTDFTYKLGRLQMFKLNLSMNSNFDIQFFK